MSRHIASPKTYTSGSVSNEFCSNFTLTLTCFNLCEELTCRFAALRATWTCRVTPRGLCNNTLLRRVLRRLFRENGFLEGFLEGLVRVSDETEVLGRVLRRGVS